MANKTVYPFGPGGQLPSGYPIADDLNTNSAQQALSAKQGMILGDEVFGTDVPIEESINPITLGAVNGYYYEGKYIDYSGYHLKRICFALNTYGISRVVISPKSGYRTAVQTYNGAISEDTFLW